MSATQFRHGAFVDVVSSLGYGITTVGTGIIALVGSAPKGPVNTPTLVTAGLADAAVFGPNTPGFSIPEALAVLATYGKIQVIVINVCDPATHKTSSAAASLAFDSNGKITLAHPFVRNVVVTDGASTPQTFVAGTDYTLDADAGTITKKAGGAIGSAANVTVSYEWVDVSKVLTADVVGSSTGAHPIGIGALTSAKAVVGVEPDIFIAPRYATQGTGNVANAVVVALQGAAQRAGASAPFDGPNTTDSDALTAVALHGSPNTSMHDPWVLGLDAAGNVAAQPTSTHIAAIMATDDYFVSPSNKVLNVLGMSRPIDSSYNDVNSRANLLNAGKVNTVVLDEGYRAWGNLATDGSFIIQARIQRAFALSIRNAVRKAVDRNLTRGLVSYVVEEVNAYGRKLTAEGAILGANCFPNAQLNTLESVAAGNVYFDVEFSAAVPAQNITLRLVTVKTFYVDVTKVSA